LRIYLADQQLIPDPISGFEPFSGEAETAELLLQQWMTNNDLLAMQTSIHVELASSLTTVFCLPFSAAMDSPAAAIRLAEGYARASMGKLAPARLAIAEPLHYGAPALVVGVKKNAGFAEAPAIKFASVQSHALAMWNRHCANLPASLIWIVVVEPDSLTFCYGQNRMILDVLTVRVHRDKADLNAVINRVLLNQFHRQGEVVFCVDEFSLTDRDKLADLVFLTALIEQNAEPFTESAH
jgi:hypothetical protein